MVFNATFNNISVLSWWPVLLVEETGLPEETLLKYAAIISYQRHSAGHKPIVTIGTHPGVIYSRLFKYTQQYTAGFTESNIGPRTS